MFVCTLWMHKASCVCIWMSVTGTECRRKVLFHFLKQMRVKSTAWGTEPTSPTSLRGRERCLIPCFCTFKTWQRQYAKNRRYGQRCVCDISVLTGVCRGQEYEWCRLIYVCDFFSGRNDAETEAESWDPVPGIYRPSFPHSSLPAK